MTACTVHKGFVLDWQAAFFSRFPPSSMSHQVCGNYAADIRLKFEDFKRGKVTPATQTPAQSHPGFYLLS